MSISLAGGVRHPKIYAYSIDQYKTTAWVGGRNGKGLVKVGETQRNVEVLDYVEQGGLIQTKVFLASQRNTIRTESANARL